jgi:uncharacterized protein (DUF362 family)
VYLTFKGLLDKILPGDMMKKINRRGFGKILLSSTLGIGASLAIPGIHPEIKKRSIVVIARSNKLKRIQHQVSKANVLDFLNRSITKITGSISASEAWKSLFSARERVGIKLSCLPGLPLSSGIGIVMAIVDGLRSAGVKGENIYIWERTSKELEKAGFHVTRSGINILGTDYFSRGGYSQAIRMSGSVGTCFSKIIEFVDALISVPVLKDHDIAGVSIGMKNFYGAIYNPNKFHFNRCDPYVADLCNFPEIKNKLRLTVCDATRIQVHNGPAFYPKYTWEYGGMLVSRDPVALDFVGWQIIEERRKELKLKSLKMSGREPTYIKSAEKLRLGYADLNRIEKIEI